MEVNTNVQLQRTQKGREEIRQKTHVLTQSERMLLVLADGVTPTQVLRRKLRSMPERPLMLAIADLTAKGFLEKAVPSESQPADKLDAATIERFVRQDPQDPIAISALTIQSELAERMNASSAGSDPDPQKAAAGLGDSRPSQSAGVDFYLPLEVPASVEVPNWQPSSSMGNLITANGTEEHHGSLRRRAKRERRGRRVQVGYWFLFAGLVCVMVWLVVQVPR
jgi:hypothetical protein